MQKYTSASCDNSVLEELLAIQNQLYHLNAVKKSGIIEDADVAILRLKKKEFELKERRVKEVHFNEITEMTILKRGRKVRCFQTNIPGHKPRCSTYEGLINKLYEFYFGGTTITDYSFKNIFELALDEKKRCENVKEKTIKDYRDTYKACITDELAAKDVRLIKPTELKEYFQKVTLELKPTKKYFYRIKGVFNLVYDYSCDPERRFVEFSPVPKNNAIFAKNFNVSSRKPEDKALQPREISILQEYLWKTIQKSHYFVVGYAILFSIEIGSREGEIPSLKWEDIKDGHVHIHSQQNNEMREGKRVFYYNPTTKNEKGISQDGRYFPLNDNIVEILKALKAEQVALGISSEWVFCNEDGSWINTVKYSNTLRRACKKLGLRLTNNHALRMALNSYVLMPMGLEVSERAMLLGHSPETNLKHYTFARANDYNEELCYKFNTFYNENRNYNGGSLLGHPGSPNILPFLTKEKSPEILRNQSFSQ